MGDLAAGTMVIKEKNYRKIHVSLDEFDYLTKDYRPTYPQASDLSLEQINVITRTLQSGKKDRTRHIASLAKKCRYFSPSLLMTVTRKLSSNHSPGLPVLCLGRNLIQTSNKTQEVLSLTFI